MAMSIIDSHSAKIIVLKTYFTGGIRKLSLFWVPNEIHDLSILDIVDGTFRIQWPFNAASLRYSLRILP